MVFILEMNVLYAMYSNGTSVMILVSEQLIKVSSPKYITRNVLISVLLCIIANLK
jgi:hypothetical protein